MKKLKNLLLGLLILAITPVWGQPPPSTPPTRRVSISGQEAPILTKFNLDFSGGSPKSLVAAIEKTTGKPLNVIIYVEDESSIKLPPLKMNNVYAAQIFYALGAASLKTEFIGPGRQWSGSAYSFQTIGEANDDSIWYFRVEKPVPQSQPQAPASYCRFYSLTPYLERGLTVDDITTAIQTGWKMLGYGPANSPDAPQPQISYHKETKLLIAVGEASKLETIDAVLKALEPKALSVTEQILENNKLLNTGRPPHDSLNSSNSNPSNTNH